MDKICPQGFVTKPCGLNAPLCVCGCGLYSHAPAWVFPVLCLTYRRMDVGTRESLYFLTFECGIEQLVWHGVMCTFSVRIRQGFSEVLARFRRGFGEASATLWRCFGETLVTFSLWRLFDSLAMLRVDVIIDVDVDVNVDVDADINVDVDVDVT